MLQTHSLLPMSTNYNNFPTIMMEQGLLRETFPFTIVGLCYFVFHFHDDGWKGRTIELRHESQRHQPASNGI